jgi:opacity protein-like surface antigen
MRRSLAVLWLIALVSDVAAQEFELPTLRGAAPYYPVPPIYHRWSGFYAGGQVGYTPLTTMDFGDAAKSLIANILRFTRLESEFSPSQWSSIPPAHPTGTEFGAFIGYNSQWDDVVLGIEGNYNIMSKPMLGVGADSISRRVTMSDNYNYDVTVTSAASMKLYDYATLRVRGGYVMGQFLPFITAGFAVGRIDYFKTASVDYPQPTYALAPTVPPSPPPPAPPPFSQTLSEGKSKAIAFGYAAGGGMDVAVLPNVFLRGEYEFVSLPVAHMNLIMHTFRGGLGLKY